jgi:hypothetical protein
VTPCPPSRRLSVAHACMEYRRRLGWPVRVDETEQCVELLTGKALVGGSQIGGLVALVDMPARLGSSVSSLLWTRNLPAVIFAAKRQLYVHPYQHTRWCYLVIADNSTRSRGRAGSPIPLLDVQVVRNTAVPLPVLDQADREATQEHGNNSITALSWIQPPNNGAERRLPRLAAVLAAICEAVTSDQRRPRARTERAR